MPRATSEQRPCSGSGLLAPQSERRASESGYAVRAYGSRVFAGGVGIGACVATRQIITAVATRSSLLRRHGSGRTVREGVGKVGLVCPTFWLVLRSENSHLTPSAEKAPSHGGAIRLVINRRTGHNACPSHDLKPQRRQTCRQGVLHVLAARLTLIMKDASCGR